MVVSFARRTKNASETATLGEELGSSYLKALQEGKLINRPVLCLFGELGSGKTTFAQGFARGIGISTRLLSPTFIIVRRYKIPEYSNFFYHIDLYRVTNKSEIVSLGLPEILGNPHDISLVEWAEKLDNIFPQKRIDVRFVAKANGEHSVMLQEL